jgi:hypothetical protein
LNVLIDHGVFDAAPLQGTISIEDLATGVKLDANTLGAMKHFHVLDLSIRNSIADNVILN